MSGGITMETAGGIAGGFAGGLAGGAIGSVFGPVGTIAGRWAGSRLGQWGGRALGGYLARKMDEANEKAGEEAKEKEKAKTKAKAKAKTDECKGDCEDKDPCEHLKKGKGKGKYRGGAHGDAIKTGTSSPRNDNLDSHHTPAKDAYKGSTLDPQQGPAIQMDPKDHGKTQSYGSSAEANDYRTRQSELMKQGRFKEAAQMDIDDIKDITRKSGDPKKYDQAIKEMEAYLKCLEEHEKGPKFDAVS